MEHPSTKVLYAVRSPILIYAMAKRKYVKRRRRKRGRRKQNSGATVDPFKRYQKGLRVVDVFPKKEDGYCDCGCGKELTGKRKRWANKECQKDALTRFWIIKGDMKVIREELRKRDHFICAYCGEEVGDFEADHILEVRHGGGGCNLDNFATSCNRCHKIKTKNNYGKKL